ncbi:hypothetical protein P22_3121 [Propionispora sp. 2/2-37]|nr:hypothetical protein P22_3121 [Propionispora sp. 2/2-37]
MRIIKTLLVTLNAKYIHSSLALRYLRACCQDVCPTIVKEYTINHNLLSILHDIYKQKPKIIGLACYIWNIDMTIALVGLIKKVLPDTLIIFGGPEVSYDPEKVMQKCHDVDYIIQGEGENTLRFLLQELAETRQKLAITELSSISGVAYRNAEGKVVINGEAQVVASLDDIPFPYTDSDMAALKDKIIYYESSRGCPFNCQYCLSSVTKGVRFHNLERVYADLTFFIRHKVKQVKFVDRTFNAKKDYYLPIMQFLAQQEGTTNFHFEIAVDLLDDEVIDFLSSVQVGRFQFEIGIQSTNEPTLKAIQRTNKWDKIVHNVTRLRQGENIHLHLDLIAGLPEESYWQFGQSFNDVYHLRPHMIQLGFLKLLKGSGLRMKSKQYGYIFSDCAPYEVLANNCLPFEDVSRLKILEGLVDQFYNSGRFQYVLPVFINLYKGNAFQFFHDFTAYWEKNECNMLEQGIKGLYQHIINFYQDCGFSDVEFFLEMVKFNALISERGKVHFPFLPWNEEKWSQEKTNFWRSPELVRKYLPEYNFTTWRDIKKQYHLEVFSFDLSSYFKEQGKLEKQLTPILFNYHGEENFQKIAVTDFWEKEGI